MTDVLHTLSDLNDAKNFYSLIEGTKVKKVISTPGPFTIFAPIDLVFDSCKLNDLKNDPELSEKFINSHIIIGFYRLDDIREVDEVINMNNYSLPISFVDGDMKIGSAKIIQGDIEASNGLIHLIDTLVFEI